MVNVHLNNGLNKHCISYIDEFLVYHNDIPSFSIFYQQMYSEERTQILSEKIETSIARRYWGKL